MKVLIFSHSFLPEIGGVEVYTDRLAAHLSSEGADVVVATATPAPEGEDAGRSYRVVRRFPARELSTLVATSDIVHCNGFDLGAFRMARKHHVPILWFHHDYDVICPKSIAWKGEESCSFSPLSCVACLRRDNSAVQVARRIASYAVKRSCLGWARVHATHTSYAGNRMGLGESVVLRCAADLIRPPGPEPQQRSGFLFAGRLIPEKGCNVLLAALARCRDLGVRAELQICGDGRNRPALERMASDLGIGESVNFLGTVSQAELAGLMDRAMAAIVPSVWDEVTGAVALEAMGRGCPVIASNVGGLGEMVRGVGLLFDRGDAVELARHMLSLAIDPQLAGTLSRQSAEAARSVYDWNLVIGDYLAAYRGMVAST